MDNNFLTGTESKRRDLGIGIWDLVSSDDYKKCILDKNEFGTALRECCDCE